MDNNAYKNGARFRSNSNIHIFSSLTKCGECGNIMIAKQDKPRIDGFAPSLYTCKGRYNNLGCSQKTISEAIVGEFVFNFISNIIKVSETKSKKPLSLDSLEKKLLKGKWFENVEGIKEMNHIFNSMYYSSDNNFKPKKSNEENKIIDFNIEHLQSELKKYKKALDKLEDLYLYDESDMSKKDYLIKKNKIQDKIDSVNKKLDATSSQITSSDCNINFILDVSTLELSKILFKGDIKMKPLIECVGRELLKEFINALVDNIVTKDRLVQSITFKNGLKVTFIHKA